MMRFARPARKAGAENGMFQRGSRKVDSVTALMPRDTA
jgi:hypothetical protein